MLILKTKPQDNEYNLLSPRGLISHPLDGFPVQGVLHLGGFLSDCPGCLATTISSLPGTRKGIAHISTVKIFFEEDFLLWKINHTKHDFPIYIVWKNVDTHVIN